TPRCRSNPQQYLPSLRGGRKGNLQGDGDTLTGLPVYVHGAVHQSRPFLNTDETQPSRGARIYSYSAVRDHQAELTGRPSEEYLGFVSVGVLDRILKGFLRHTVDA